MKQSLNKEDIRLIGELFEKKLGPVVRKIEGVDSRLTASVRDLKEYVDSKQSALLKQAHKDTEQLLGESRDELVEAIEEVILKEEVASLRSELKQVDARLVALESQ